MFTRPAGLPDTALVDALAAAWELPIASLEYRAVGFGSHHWRAVEATGAEHFVTIDDLAAGFQAVGTDAAFAALERAYTTAAFLRDEAGLEFVVAPRGDEEGKIGRAHV